MSKNYIFDLDGTLVDSFIGIQASYDYAYFKLYQKENLDNIKQFVGPPIVEILKKLTGETNQNNFDLFLTYFKEKYDKDGFKMYTLYPEIKNVINSLYQNGHKLYVCTNKREIPTIKIMNEIDSERLFSSYYSLDMEGRNFRNKSELLNFLISQNNLNKKDSIMIGDSENDYKAAIDNEISFIFAKYGYGKAPDESKFINSPIELLK